MRHQVPFVGERKLVRANDEEARIKRISGRVIDDVVGEGVASSSWEDIVPEGWVDTSLPKSQQPAITLPANRPVKPVTPRIKVPIRSGSISPTGANSTGAQLVTATKAAPAPNAYLAAGNSAGHSVPGYSGVGHSGTGHSGTGHSGVGYSSVSSSAVSAAAYTGPSSLDWIYIHNGRGVRVNIHGAINHHLRKDWALLLEATADSIIEEVEFNFSDSPSLNLTGLGMLLLFKEKKRVTGEMISLCNCNKEVTQLLEWARMDRYFTIKKTHISDDS